MSGVVAPKRAGNAARRPLLQLALALSALVAVTEVLVADGPAGRQVLAYLTPALGGLYIAVGLLAWWRRPTNRVGSLTTACGVTIVASSLSATAIPVLFAVGAITATLPLAVLIHLVHAFPSGELRGRAARWTVAGSYLTSLVLQVPLWAFAPAPAPYDVLLVSPRPDLVSTGATTQAWVGGAVVVVTVWLLVLRLRNYGAADRTLLAWLLGLAVLAVIAVPVSANALPPLGATIETVSLVQIGVVAIPPLGFLFVVLRGGFARLGDIDRFAASIASATGTSVSSLDLDDAISVALGDPSAALLRRTADGFVDRDGRAADLPVTDVLRAAVPIGMPGAVLGAVVYDTSLGADTVALAAVTHMVGVALERERLAREVSLSRNALQDASRRVLQAADTERRRIARDLHDGLQGGLVLLSLQARQLAQAVTDERGPAATKLAEGLDEAASTLRGLVNGVLPGPLVERGLGPAIRELADDLPLTATVDVAGLRGRLPGPVETTAYFVVAEALTNVVKHAGATTVAVVAAVEGGELSVEVVDDGVGGAAPTTGSGLAGLRDRLSILAGSLCVESDERGTRLIARMPFE